MINKLKIKKRGFTLVETLIAVFVLMLAIAGPLTIASKGLQTTLIAKDQDTAFFLAQDAVEYVRWVRDTNSLKGQSWLAGLDGTSNGHTSPSADCTGANGCTVDSLKDITAACSGACSAISYDATNNYFSYSSGTASIFTRTVKIAKTVGTNDCTAGHGCEASVTVIVSWSDTAGITRSVSVREDLFSWQ